MNILFDHLIFGNHVYPSEKFHAFITRESASGTDARVFQKFQNLTHTWKREIRLKNMPCYLSRNGRTRHLSKREFPNTNSRLDVGGRDALRNHARVFVPEAVPEADSSVLSVNASVLSVKMYCLEADSSVLSVNASVRSARTRRYCCTIFTLL